MKRITENKPVHYTLIIATVLLISGFLIGMTYRVTTPIIKARELEEQLNTYRQLVDNIDDFEVLIKTSTFEATLAFNQNKETIAVIYTSTEINLYGPLQIAYSVDVSGKILKAFFLDYQQTLSLKGITEDNLSLFVGLLLGELPASSDLISGATGSYDSLVDAFSKGKEHFETLSLAPNDPFSVLVDGYAYKQVDVQFDANDTVIQKEIIYDDNHQVLGHLYTLFGTGPYLEDGEDKDIQFYVAVDANNTILGILVFREEYNHSGGAFFNRIINYLNGFKGQTLQTLSYDVDWSAGATSGNSKVVVDRMIQALVEVLS